jgi:TPR repeat protein
VKWLRLSAEQGCPTGMAKYGWCLLNAIDVESHQQNGLDNIQRAADLNDPKGTFLVGVRSPSRDSQLRRQRGSVLPLSKSRLTLRQPLNFYVGRLLRKRLGYSKRHFQSD